jgi:hypothetical protein
MNRELCVDLVLEYAGADLSDREAIELIEACEDSGLFDESAIINCDECTWNQLIIRAVERAGNAVK